ncbi:phosphoribosylglycinamide formyltransferase [Shouchella clausii]|uniref:phosphoribosylglycinamide formyltransferase n=1 Tax=Shouchella clausii TaxID=79880 RepID=UPI000BA65FB4|nr:phosphoribosylglycinamide formyltransferase [Shouchella clausii]PAD43880.1 phosphoribosylglycinamide formyltransferase [Bacillus sp. 7520-S]MBU8597016.1 phosphoribosylglycinamide formyltransferase [Shouchella clausii]MCY1104472.1 phosphoribosylglycinamide formyltransferase [Shouchella clausii]MEB5480656.1 phosphoribosylglycinamide formyltransferase [Shouchella clausii]MED4157202.1 phosphoribosylglycinamide formyltransferase [Shouchella clausii]
MKVAVFASGTGTNAEALIKAAKTGELGGEIALVVSDKQHAPVLEKARNLGVKAEHLPPQSFSNKAAYEQAILALLTKEGIGFIVLAGYMRLIGPTLLEAYQGKMINIHPSLLPAFPGLDAIGQALEAKADTTGVTIHYVDAGMDTGPVIAQQQVAIAKGETRETLTAKIQAVEHTLYPAVVKQVLNEHVEGEQQ